MKRHIQLRYSDDLPGMPLLRTIETIARADRQALGCRFGEPCDPRQLIQFHDVLKILETHASYTTHYGRPVAEEFEQRWSGLLLHIKDGDHIIMVNPNHSLPRRTFTVAHEFGHLVLNHQPIFITNDTMPTSRYSDEQEHEAYCYGLAILLPYAPLLQMLRQQATVPGIAHHYGVSTQAVEMRLKLIGLWEMYTT